MAALGWLLNLGFAGGGDVSHLGSGTAATDGTSIATGSVSPSANSLILVIAAGNRGTGAPTHDSVTSTFNIVGSFQNIVTLTSGDARHRTSYWWAITTASPGSGTVTCNFGGNANRRAIIADQILNVTAGPIQNTSNVVTTNSLTLTLASALQTGNVTWGGIQNVAGTGVTPGTGETELAEVSSGGSNEARIQTQHGSTTEHDWTGLATTSNMGCVLEAGVLAALAQQVLGHKGRGFARERVFGRSF